MTRKRSPIRHVLRALRYATPQAKPWLRERDNHARPALTLSWSPEAQRQVEQTEAERIRGTYRDADRCAAERHAMIGRRIERRKARALGLAG